MMFNLTDAAFGTGGGLLIGLAATLMLLFNGRVTGVSGMTNAVMRRSAGLWRIESALFLAGLIAAPAIYTIAYAKPDITLTADPLLLVVGGLLVGFGVSMGSGCASGHGVCGITRFSSRSIAATCAFMGVAMATVFAMNLLG